MNAWTKANEIDLHGQIRIKEQLYDMYRGWTGFSSDYEKEGKPLECAFPIENLIMIFKKLSTDAPSLKPPPPLIRRFRHIEEEDLLLQLVKSLVVLVDPDSLLLLEQPADEKGEGINFKQVFVVMPSAVKWDKDSLGAHLEFLVSGRFNFSLQVINRGQLFHNFESSDLFFQIFHPCFQVLYSRPGMKPVPEEIRKHLDEAKKIALRRFTIHAQRSRVFVVLSAKARELGQNGMSLYLLHQSFELLLRGLIKAWGQKEKKTHDLKTLIFICKRWVPLLNNLFTNEPDLLRLLNNAYIDARYNMGFSVQEDILDAGTKKIESFLSYTEKEMSRVLR
ncbi:HEPN domain-containing protein [Anditalea andensis]|uniref:HEPN domain-containing protein n=1 Tax=Anditalea andensis TaxID=1048983 RepID=A0A074KSL2_9BACT|nr:HEPN domain-containing protein [Anditalea andensis]KEO72951.1 hypothetical protein EL17_15140 [Anditalea andensis]